MSTVQLLCPLVTVNLTSNNPELENKIDVGFWLFEVVGVTPPNPATSKFQLQLAELALVEP